MYGYGSATAKSYGSGFPVPLSANALRNSFVVLNDGSKLWNFVKITGPYCGDGSGLEISMY